MLIGYLKKNISKSLAANFIILELQNNRKETYAYDLDLSQYCDSE